MQQSLQEMECGKDGWTCGQANANIPFSLIFFWFLSLPVHLGVARGSCSISSCIWDVEAMGDLCRWIVHTSCNLHAQTVIVTCRCLVRFIEAQLYYIEVKLVHSCWNCMFESHPHHSRTSHTCDRLLCNLLAFILVRPRSFCSYQISLKPLICWFCCSFLC